MLLNILVILKTQVIDRLKEACSQNQELTLFLSLFFKGKTRRGLNFERTTEQATTTAQVVFKTMFAGDEFSAKIGSAAVRIMNVLFIKKGNEETVKITAKAKYGTVTPAEQTKGVRARGFFFLQYKPPTNSALAGLSDYVTIQASYRPGEITTHRISILLLS